MKYHQMKSGIMKDEQGNMSKPKVSQKIEGQVVETEIEYIMRDTDKALIPCVLGNADYQEYLNDTEKVVEDFDYEAEETRQATEGAIATAAREREEEIQAEMRKMAEERILAKGK